MNKSPLWAFVALLFLLPACREDLDKIVQAIEKSQRPEVKEKRSLPDKKKPQEPEKNNLPAEQDQQDKNLPSPQPKEGSDRLRLQLARIEKDNKTLYRFSEELKKGERTFFVGYITLNTDGEALLQWLQLEQNQKTYELKLFGRFSESGDGGKQLHFTVRALAESKYEGPLGLGPKMSHNLSAVSGLRLDRLLRFPTPEWIEFAGEDYYHEFPLQFTWTTDDFFANEVVFQEKETRRYIFKPYDDPEFTIDDPDPRLMNYRVYRSFQSDETPWGSDLRIYSSPSNVLTLNPYNKVYYHEAAIRSHEEEGKYVVEVSFAEAKQYLTQEWHKGDKPLAPITLEKFQDMAKAIKNDLQLREPIGVEGFKLFYRTPFGTRSLQAKLASPDDVVRFDIPALEIERRDYFKVCYLWNGDQMTHCQMSPVNKTTP